MNNNLINQSVKNKIILLIALLSALFSHSTHAQSEVIVGREITHIRTYANRAQIFFSPTFDDSQGCGTSNSHASIVLDDGSTTRREMLASALTAATAGLRVNIGINGCYNNHPEVYRIDVRFQD